MIKRIRNLVADDRGTSLVEMALATPFMAATLMGMVDLSRAYSDKLRLEQAAQVAIERVMNRQMTSTSYNTLKSEAASAAGVAESAVTVDFWLQCNGTRQTDYDTSCTTGQTSARYISIEVQKDFMPTFGTKYFPGANSNGTYTIRSKAGIRTQ